VNEHAGSKLRQHERSGGRTGEGNPIRDDGVPGFPTRSATGDEQHCRYGELGEGETPSDQYRLHIRITPQSPPKLCWNSMGTSNPRLYTSTPASSSSRIVSRKSAGSSIASTSSSTESASVLPRLSVTSLS